MQKIELVNSKIIIGNKIFKDYSQFQADLEIYDYNFFNLNREKLSPIYPNILFNPSEEAKSLNSYAKIMREFLKFKLKRNSLIKVFGGGISLDLGGFLASTYLRGVKVDYYPTTLLSMVDASVGGKTGFNLGLYKNMVGSFKQPGKVICDIQFLKTVSQEEFTNGLFEAIKHGLILDREHFYFIQNNFEDLLAGNYLEELISKSIQLKKSVVERDEQETNLRKILNFGHSFGHAIEKTYKLKHGFAIGYGMLIAVKISEQKQLLSEKKANQIRKFLLNILKEKIDFDYKILFNILTMDKKSSKESIELILLEDIGNCQIVELSFNNLLELIEKLKNNDIYKY